MKVVWKIWVGFLMLLLTQQLPAQPVSINEDWLFLIGEDTLAGNWARVDLPHTYNSQDPFDKVKGYYRGVAWYKKMIPSVSGDEVFIRFEAVNQEAVVYVNGQEAGRHLGGYTAFSVNVSKFLTKDENTLLVRVDNAHNVNIPPLKGDFNFYGGIYRDVWMEVLNPVHFDRSEFGDQGIFISTPDFNGGDANVHVKANIWNAAPTNQEVILNHELRTNQGQLVTSWQEKVTMTTGINTLLSKLPTVKKPELWHPDSPVLYRLTSTILSNKGQKLHQQYNSIGFRWFRFDADQGFFLNGQPLKLIGSNRHQDMQGFGNALSDDRHRKDVELIKKMSANFFRTAHYPQDPAVLRAADELGLVVSMEIPLDHDITDSDAFLQNSKRMMVEMIRQYYNHPSIFIWAYMNEMMLGRKWKRDQAIIEKIRLLAVELEAVTRSEDSTRYTMIPNHGDLDIYINAGLTDIPMIVGWNLYYGWYESDEQGAGKFLDQFHQLRPDKPVLITEYGGGADPRIRSMAPERFDFSVEWQNQFHQSNLIQIYERKYLSGAAIWNLADFGSEDRKDADAKINSKGVLSYDRQPKDSYFLYQAWLSKSPYVHIGSDQWDDRTMLESEGFAGNEQVVQVYSNQESVELIHNGKSLSSRPVKNNVSEWRVIWVDGPNQLEAVAGQVKDAAQIEVNLISPNKVNWSQGISVNCGTTFFFQDHERGITWLPDAPYKDGLWGYQSGEMYRPRDRGIGTDQIILGTDLDPLYQTIRQFPEYIFDTEPGVYEIIFHWADVTEGSEVFDVLVNGKTMLKAMSPASQGAYQAFSKKMITETSGALEISFKVSSGTSFINGIQIRKIN